MIDIILFSTCAIYVCAMLLNLPNAVRKFTGIPSSLRWIALAWILMFAGMAMFATRTHVVASVEDIDAPAINQAIMFGVAIVILAVAALFRAAALVRHAMKLPVVCMLSYGILGTVSASFSPAPALSAYKGALILVDGALICVCLAYIEPNCRQFRRLMLELCYVMLGLMIFGAALGGVLEAESARRSSLGVFGFQLYGVWPMLNPNELGFISAIVAVVAVRRSFEFISTVERAYWVSVAILSITVLVFSQARTAIIGFGFAMAWFGFLMRRLRLVALLSACAVFGAAAVNVVLNIDSSKTLEVVQRYSERGLSAEQIRSMSGRTDLWQAGLRMFSDSPIVGHGYDAGVRLAGEVYGIPNGIHLHNSHLQVLVNSGLAGYAMWFCMVFSVGWALLRTVVKMRWPLRMGPDGLYLEALMVFFVMLIRTMTGQVLVTHQYSLMIFMGLIVFIGVRRRQETQG